MVRRQLAIPAAREVAVERRGRYTNPPRHFGKGRAAFCQQGTGKALVLLREIARAPSLPVPCPGCGSSARLRDEQLVELSRLIEVLQIVSTANVTAVNEDLRHGLATAASHHGVG